MIAAGQAILGLYQEDDREDPGKYYNEENVRPLVAAARILDSAAEFLADESPSVRKNLALTAAVAFAMYGNFPSATAVLRRSLSESEYPTGTLAAVASTVAPSLIGHFLASVQGPPEVGEYLERLEQFLSTGSTRSMESLRRLYIACLVGADSPFASSLMRSSRIVLEHILQLSLARALGAYSNILPRGYVPRLIDSGVRVLLPPQFKAIVLRGLLSDGGNRLIALPTSTGKTLLGEVTLAAALRRKPGLVCYVAPYVALGRQVAESFAAHLPPPVRVHALIGGYDDSGFLEPAGRMEVVVATPERFDAMLRSSPGLSNSLRGVVFDEAHLVENDSRGVRLEGLITRLRLMQEAGLPVRLTLLSAVMARYGALTEWAGVSENGVIEDNWRPTARRLAFWTQDGRLVWHFAGDPIHPPGATPRSVLGQLALPWPQGGIYPTPYYGHAKKQRPLVHENIAYLSEYLWRKYGSPMLCVCATKDDTRRVATAVARRFPRLEPTPPLVSRAIASITQDYQYLRPMREMLNRGVAFHNSTVPHPVRRLIEEAVASGEMKVVAATTTLAEGVDLPFRFTILVDWLAWRSGKQAPMSPLLFRNIAGRCGRAGVYTEGDTVVFDNPLGDVSYTDPVPRRREAQAGVFLHPEATELKSALEESGSTSSDSATLAVLGSQFLASIPENPLAQSLAADFGNSTLWARRRPGDPRIPRVLTEIASSLLDPQAGALAVAASPLHLTPLGSAANVTGFSPASCRKILAFLKHEPPDPDIVNVCASALEELGTLPEQPSPDLRKALAGSHGKFCVRRGDLQFVLRAHINHVSSEVIFSELPYVKKSSRRPGVDDWLSGSEGARSWDEVFDKFSDFLASVVQGFLPWSLRACARLSAFAGGWSETVPWREWADSFQGRDLSDANSGPGP